MNRSINENTKIALQLGRAKLTIKIKLKISPTVTTKNFKVLKNLKIEFQISYGKNGEI